MEKSGFSNLNRVKAQFCNASACCGSNLYENSSGEKQRAVSASKKLPHCCLLNHSVLVFTQSPLNFSWVVLFCLELGRIQNLLMKKQWQWSQVLDAYKQARVLHARGSRKDAKFTCPSVSFLPSWFSAVCSREMLPLMVTGCTVSCWNPWRCREDPSLKSLFESLNKNEENGMFCQSLSTEFIFLVGYQTFLTHPISRTPVGQHKPSFSTWTSFWLCHKKYIFKNYGNMRL